MSAPSAGAPWDRDATFFLIEEGQANRGDMTVALEMVRLAAATGADGIEFQLAIADDFYVGDHPQHAAYSERELAEEDIRALAAATHEAGLAITAAPLSERLPEQLAAAGYDALTVNSSDVTNPRMLDAVAATGLPVLLGTAMAELDEIDWAVQRLRRASASVCVLHGQHVMHGGKAGVPVDAVSLSTIGFFRERYGVPAGFIDHTRLRELPALAAAHGAAVVTKHLAPEAGWTGPDAAICLTPAEMAEAVELVRLADAAHGVGDKRTAAGEDVDRKAMRRSVVAAADLAAGVVLAPEHLALKRPGGGLDAREVEALVGRTLRVALRRDQPLQVEDVNGTGT